MKHPTILLALFLLAACTLQAQTRLDSLLPVRGFCIGAPKPNDVDRFVKFITQELAPRKVNTLILRVDYSYQFKSHPELADTIALSNTDVKKMVAACKQNGIRIIPQINLLGHQSWASKTTKLLAVYPDFDETPQVKMPAKYEWPNADKLYCKSYCPLHPGVHKIVFDVVDEICDAFETDAFHAGMDEVFYLGEETCPRCGGRDKAELFAGEVRTIRDHLAQKTGSYGFGVIGLLTAKPPAWVNGRLATTIPAAPLIWCRKILWYATGIMSVRIKHPCTLP